MSNQSFQAPSAEYLAGLLPQYDIECFIAQGGMGAVYKGRQISLDRDVAIKILPTELGVDGVPANKHCRPQRDEKGVFTVEARAGWYRRREFPLPSCAWGCVRRGRRRARRGVWRGCGGRGSASWRRGGCPTAQYKQVGNAVPPFLSHQIAGVVAQLPGDELVVLQGPDGRYLGRNATEEIGWVDDDSKAHKYWRKLDAVDAQVRDVKRQYGVDWIIVKL